MSEKQGTPVASPSASWCEVGFYRRGRRLEDSPEELQDPEPRRATGATGATGDRIEREGALAQAWGQLTAHARETGVQAGGATRGDLDAGELGRVWEQIGALSDDSSIRLGYVPQTRRTVPLSPGFSLAQGDVVTLRLVNLGPAAARFDQVRFLPRPQDLVVEEIRVRQGPDRESAQALDGEFSAEVFSAREFSPSMLLPLVAEGGWISVRLRVAAPTPGDGSPLTVLFSFSHPADQVPRFRVDVEIDLREPPGGQGAVDSWQSPIWGSVRARSDEPPWPGTAVSGRVVGVRADDSWVSAELDHPPVGSLEVRGHPVSARRVALRVPATSGLAQVFLGLAHAVGRVVSLDVPADAAGARVTVFDGPVTLVPPAWRGEGAAALPLSDVDASGLSEPELGGLLVGEVSHGHAPDAPYVASGACLICERHASVEMMCLSLASFRNVGGNFGYGRPGHVVGEVARAWQRIAEEVGVARARLRFQPLRPEDVDPVLTAGDGDLGQHVLQARWRVLDARVPLRVEIEVSHARDHSVGRVEVTVSLERGGSRGPGREALGSARYQHRVETAATTVEHAAIDLSGAARAGSWLEAGDTLVAAVKMVSPRRDHRHVTVAAALFTRAGRP